MKLGLPRKRAILAFHRWLGVLSALFLLVLALTGLALNHTERLGLNNVTISNGLILERYGMVGASDIQSFGIGDTATISHLDGQLFYNGDYLTDAGEPVGYFKAEGFSVIACPARLVFLTDQGEFIEQLNVSRLPFDEVTFLAVGDGKSPVIVAGDGQWQPDVDWLEFSPHVGAFSVNPLPVVEAGTEVQEFILSLY
jgi:hypothetical protein